MAVENVPQTLLNWYDRHARKLPWRIPPGSNAHPDPYAVWMSEIMLQQTTVAAVAPYFERFMARWPTVSHLAASSDEDVMAAWAGLGYYSRARNLLACARMVVERHGGAFPADEAALLALPGVGPYTAAAIAAIAFGLPATVVDGNVERVVSRLFAVDTPLPSARPELRRLAATLTPAIRPGDFAQAMMDLGATICTPRSPRCLSCPIGEGCSAYRLGLAENFPVKAVKAAKPERRGTAFWIENKGRVLLVRRPPTGLLGGMRALPSSEWGLGEAPVSPPIAGQWRQTQKQVRHIFTHFALTLDIAMTVTGDSPEISGEWWPLEQLEDAGLPTLFAKAAAIAVAERQSA
jgi:A/G-specific adenine glycosylase